MRGGVSFYWLHRGGEVAEKRGGRARNGGEESRGGGRIWRWEGGSCTHEPTECLAILVLSFCSLPFSRFASHPFALDWERMCCCRKLKG